MKDEQTINRRLKGITRAYGNKIIALSLSAIDSLRDNPTTLDELKASIRTKIRHETDRLLGDLTVTIPPESRDTIQLTNLEANQHGPS